ncbi:MAG TPA: hypothetical protein VKU82_02360, partial [Planctomycetaceae bacterium]|nr:hypothetical protein [Planctomycetaceae bacterium]
LDERRKESIKTVAHHARGGVKGAVAENVSSEETKSSLSDLTDLFADIADDVAGTPEFNGFFRTWSSGHAGLTTVGGVKVSDPTKVIEFLQKQKGKNREGHEVRLKVSSAGGVDIHQMRAAQWHQDTPELFDQEGSVYVGTGERTVWYALGEQALDKLKQAIQESTAKGAQSSPAELHAKLLPLAEVWDKIRTRHPDLPENVQKAAQSESKDTRSKAARAASTVHDLKLSKLAVEAFQKGHDTFSAKLSRQGEGLELVGDVDEGLLRFAGLALSKFTKDNLSD